MRISFKHSLLMSTVFLATSVASFAAEEDLASLSVEKINTKSEMVSEREKNPSVEIDLYAPYANQENFTVDPLKFPRFFKETIAATNSVGEAIEISVMHDFYDRPETDGQSLGDDLITVEWVEKEANDDVMTLSNYNNFPDNLIFGEIRFNSSFANAFHLPTKDFHLPTDEVANILDETLKIL